MQKPYLSHEDEIDVIDPNTQMHYAQLSSFEHTRFPHCHDFFEFSLILEGSQLMVVNGCDLIMDAGCLILVRPGDVHSRSYMKPGSHINVAFPAKVGNQLFEYLGDGYPSKFLLSAPIPPYIMLDETECANYHQRLDELNLVRINNVALLRTKLRVLIMDMFVHHLAQYDWMALNEENKWFRQLLAKMENHENLAEGLPKLLELSNRSHEHMCRLFQRELGCTPTQYVNDLRLNYVANALTHSNMDIIDISMNAGFENLSHFYHLFKKKFDSTPHKFRRSHQHFLEFKEPSGITRVGSVSSDSTAVAPDSPQI
jgi:AraC family cel operon transcriptional repressor